MLPEIELEALLFLARADLGKCQVLSKDKRDLVERLSNKLALHGITEISATEAGVTLWVGRNPHAVPEEEIDERLPFYLHNAFIHTLEITWLTDWYFLFIWQAHWQGNSFLNKVIMPLGDRGYLAENQWALEFFANSLRVKHYSFANVKVSNTRDVFLANEHVRNSAEMLTIFTDQLPWPRLEEQLAYFKALTFAHLHVSGGDNWIRQFLKHFLEFDGFAALRNVVLFYQTTDKDDEPEIIFGLSYCSTAINGIRPAHELVPICIRKTQRFLSGKGCAFSSHGSTANLVIWKGANEEDDVLPYRIALITPDAVDTALDTMKMRMSCAVRGCNQVKLGSCKSQSDS